MGDLKSFLTHGKINRYYLKEWSWVSFLTWLKFWFVYEEGSLRLVTDHCFSLGKEKQGVLTAFLLGWACFVQQGRHEGNLLPPGGSSLHTVLWGRTFWVISVSRHIKEHRHICACLLGSVNPVRRANMLVSLWVTQSEGRGWKVNRFTRPGLSSTHATFLPGKAKSCWLLPKTVR
jgi:hypothetical protein